MTASVLVEALRRQRAQLAARWRCQFTANRQTAGRADVGIGETLVGALFDEAILLLAASNEERIPRRHHADALARIAPFPESVALCIDLFQAGSQVLGSFVVENAGPFAAWNTTTRNTFLGELDSVFHILVHREIEALCELRPVRSSDPADIPPAIASFLPISGSVRVRTFLPN